MNKVLAIVLLIFTLSMEAEMATLNRTGAAAARPAQQQQQNVPAWMNANNAQTASNKNKDVLRNALPPGDKNTSNVLAPRDPRKEKDEMNLRDPRPAWMDAAQSAWNIASPLLAGPAGIPNSVSQLVNTFGVPGVQSVLPAGKGNDTLAPGSPNKNRNQMGRLSGRTLFGPGIATIDDLAYWNQYNAPEGSGFGSNYGGNWGRGGGGGGGGGGWGGSDGGYPAWLSSLMRLYSWNIK